MQRESWLRVLLSATTTNSDIFQWWGTVHCTTHAGWLGPMKHPTIPVVHSTIPFHHSIPLNVDTQIFATMSDLPVTPPWRLVVLSCLQIQGETGVCFKCLSYSLFLLPTALHCDLSWDTPNTYSSACGQSQLSTQIHTTCPVRDGTHMTKLSRHSPTYTYCKWVKAGLGLENETITLLVLDLALVHKN